MYSRDPEFYAFSRTLEIYSEGGNTNSVLILTTDSDYYRYLKHATPVDDDRIEREEQADHVEGKEKDTAEKARDTTEDALTSNRLLHLAN